MKNAPRILILFALFIIALFVSGGVKSAYEPNHPEYPRLTSRALGMGGAGAAWIDDASSIFHNPAGLGRIRSLSFSHAHSRNHFPGEIENLDQLDCDPTSFIVPLTGALFGWPAGSAGAGWVLHGELGYDYRTRNDESIPHERLFGMGPGDRAEGAGFHLWPGGYFGFTHRMSEYLFTSGADIPDGVTWRRTGEGYSCGVQQTVIQGIQYGSVYEQMDYDYLPFRTVLNENENYNIKGERTKSIRTGWSVRPTAWLLVAWDNDIFSRKEYPSDGNMEPIISKLLRKHWGVEIIFGQWFMYRFGSFDGHPTSGWSYKIGPWRSDSAWVEGFMPEMVRDYPPSQDLQIYHPTGFNLGE